MSDDTKIVRAPATVVGEELPDDGSEDVQVGQWFWVKDREGEWLGCVVNIGSNFVKLQQANCKYEGSARVHFDDFWEECRREPDPEAYIQGKIAKHQGEVKRLMGEVREITARLGVSPSPELSAAGVGETKALATINSNENVDAYKAALVKAQKDTLPELFKEIEANNNALAVWLTAELIPLKAEAKKMTKVIKRIENRIFSVQLYAGLIEEVEQIADGEPAPLDAKVHLLQRRHFMDEECLARYQTGGMEFKDIRAFDAWLVAPEQRDRLLPFPRCVVVFRVRRYAKSREVNTLRDFIRVIEEKSADESTFLYLRNGEKVYRLSTGIEFGEQLFPDTERNSLSGVKVWAETFAGSVKKLISDNEYQQMMQERAERQKEWQKQNKAYQEALKSPEAKARAKAKKLKRPDSSCVDVPWPGSNPNYDYGDRYTPFDPSNVLYDDIAKKIAEDMEHHNRIALVLQGLLDRSPVFHPHPPWQLFTDEGFRAGLELIYDETRALAPGPMPDFKEYRARLNKTLREGCVTVGQEDAWEKAEAKKENARRDRDWRWKGDYRPERFRPDGDPGPGTLARVSRHTRTGKCTYEWERERRNARWDNEDKIHTSFVCDASKVLNVDAYTPGDFKIFFNDPRTRAKYLRWAPYLLEAEEYHAGNRKLPPPVKKEPKPRKEPSWENQRKYERRKMKALFMGKAVRLRHAIHTQGGQKYEANSLWRVFPGYHRKGLTIRGITEDGAWEEPSRSVACVDHLDLYIVSNVPPAPDSRPGEEEPEVEAPPESDPPESE